MAAIFQHSHIATLVLRHFSNLEPHDVGFYDLGAESKHEAVGIAKAINVSCQALHNYFAINFDFNFKSADEMGEILVPEEFFIDEPLQGTNYLTLY